MEKGEKLNEKEAIEEFLDRGVERIYPSREFLREKLLSGEKLSMYLGIDPTGLSLHLGHTIPLIKLAQFQKLGHKAILLIGDFTAMVGDPTDKMSARHPLSKKQVLDNCQSYKKQASRFIKFSGENPAALKYNSKWLAKMSMTEIVKLLSLVTYAQTIKRDMFQKRIAENKDLYLHEFLYPVMHGFDSVALQVNGEIGGNDQTFNMLVGRDLIKKINHKEKFVIATKLLTDSSGMKMGKTEGNMVSLDESPREMFGKIMSWPDSLILLTMELCTKLSLSEISKAKTDLESGVSPRDVKLKLAEAVVSIYHGEKKAMKARADFLGAFSEGKLPKTILEFKAEAGKELQECLLKSNFIKSKNEFRRLVGEGAVSLILADGVSSKITDYTFKISSSAVFKIGKHRFLKIVT